MTLEILGFTGIVLRIIVSIMAFYVSILFFIKIKHAKGTGFDLSQFLGLGIFTFFAGIMEIIFAYYFYYLYEIGSEIFGIYLAAMTAGSIGLTGLIFFSEKIIKRTKYAITIISIIYIIWVIFFSQTIQDIQLLSTIIQVSIVLVFLIMFTFTIISKIKGEIRRKMIGAFFGMLVILFFYMLDTEVGQSILPFSKEILIIISMTGLIIFVFFWGLILLSIETLTEFEWRDKLKELFIIAPNGGTLFHYNFEKETDFHEPDLITAGLTGVKDILAEMVQSKEKLKVVDHQDIKIIFEYGTYSILALITYENLRIYHSKLAQLMKQFEKFYQDVFIHWSGEIEVFRPSKELIEEIFG